MNSDSHSNFFLFCGAYEQWITIFFLNFQTNWNKFCFLLYCCFCQDIMRYVETFLKMCWKHYSEFVVRSVENTSFYAIDISSLICNFPEQLSKFCLIVPVEKAIEVCVLCMQCSTSENHFQAKPDARHKLVSYPAVPPPAQIMQLVQTWVIPKTHFLYIIPVLKFTVGGN